MTIRDVSYDWAGALETRPETTALILHHAAASVCSPQEVHRWHLANGWCGIGYHFFVRKDGTVYRGRPEAAVGAHTYGHNRYSIGVCFEGNFETETMGAAQRAAGAALVSFLRGKYPAVSAVYGHRDLDATACPGRNFPFAAIAAGAAKEEEEMTEAQVRAVASEAAKQAAKEAALQAAKQTADRLREENYRTLADVPAWGRGAVDKLLRRGALAGDGAGLNISYTLLRVLVILNALGVLD